MILHPRFDDRWRSLSDHERDVVIAAYWRSQGIEVPDAEIERFQARRREANQPKRPRYIVRDNCALGMWAHCRDWQSVKLPWQAEVPPWRHRWRR